MHFRLAQVINPVGLNVGFRLENSALEAEEKSKLYADCSTIFAKKAEEEEKWGSPEESRYFRNQSIEMGMASREYSAKAQFFRELSYNPSLLYASPKGAPKPLAKAPSPMFRSAATTAATQPSGGFGNAQNTQIKPIRPMTTPQTATSGGTSPQRISDTGRATTPTAKTSKTASASIPSGTYADRETLQIRIDQTEQERDAYISACNGNPDVMVLNYYDRLLEELYSAMDALPTEAINEEVLLQTLGGNYYTGRPTIGGTAARASLGILGLDLPADIQDLEYDITHLDSIPKGQLALDAMAVLPFIGGIKYLDDSVDAVKAVTRTTDVADVVADAAKHTDEIIDTVGNVSYNGIKQYSQSELVPADLMNELANSGVKYTRENVMMVTKNYDGDLMWLEQGSSRNGWIHIIEKHGQDFRSGKNSCYTKEEIQGLMKTFLESKPLDRGKSPIDGSPYMDYLYNGKRYRIGFGDNGYIKSFFPVPSKKK